MRYVLNERIKDVSGPDRRRVHHPLAICQLAGQIEGPRIARQILE